MLAMVTLLLGAQALAADVCTNQNGSLVYDSAITIGKSVWIKNPRLILGEKTALIYGASNADGLCKALGFTDGLGWEVTEASPEDMVAMFNHLGELYHVTNGGPKQYAMESVTCAK
jgi:hypothetical protein